MSSAVLAPVMTRSALAASGGSNAAVAQAADAAVRGTQTRLPGVTVWPVTTDHVAVIVKAPTGELVEVQHASGSCERTSANGIAVLGLAVGSANSSQVLVTSPTVGCQPISVDTSVAAVVASLLRVVNKHIALAERDVPGRLVTADGVEMDPRSRAALEGMLAAADAQGTPLKVVSGYRAFDDQQRLYDAYSARDGQAAADRFSARPGHSEHQLGLAFDLGAQNGVDELKPSFAGTAAGQWIAAHAHEHGFVVRYCSGQEKLSGYEPEPWHVRYVGPEVAQFLNARPDIHTLEELFGLPAAPGY